MDHREMASRGGKIAAAKLTPEQRAERARKGAEARWANARKKAERKAARAAAKAAKPPEPTPSTRQVVESAIDKSKTDAPWVGPSKTPIKGEVGMPGHNANCQCMACRAYRAGWRPE